MPEKFWNKRYAENETVYGTAPNKFFKLFIDQHKPGTILLPGEGEGRNAVYAAKKGWKVEAFDFSPVAREKALELAKQQKVQINYEVKSIESFVAEKQYDAVALVYVHLEPVLRAKFHLLPLRKAQPNTR